MISKHAFPSPVSFAGPHSMHCPMKLRSLWCPPAGLGANKRCQIICDPSTLARLASAAVEPRKHSSLAQSHERRGSGTNFAAALRASNHVNVRKNECPAKPPRCYCDRCDRLSTAAVTIVPFINLSLGAILADRGVVCQPALATIQFFFGMPG